MKVNSNTVFLYLNLDEKSIKDVIKKVNEMLEKGNEIVIIPVKDLLNPKLKFKGKEVVGKFNVVEFLNNLTGDRS